MIVTTKNLQKAKPVDVIRTICDAMSKQYGPSYAGSLLDRKAGSIATAYRGAYDRKCAAGVIIDDDDYKEEMEGLSWKELVKKRLVPKAHAAIIIDCQEKHDAISLLYQSFNSNQLGGWKLCWQLLKKDYEVKYA